MGREVGGGYLCPYHMHSFFFKASLLSGMAICSSLILYFPEPAIQLAISPRTCTYIILEMISPYEHLQFNLANNLLSLLL